MDTGTFFGGMFKARNVIEAGILTAAVGLPLFIFIPLGLTPRIIILCLTALPLMLVALIGISGESLSAFLIVFLKYLKNRRVIGKSDAVCPTGKVSKENNLKKENQSLSINGYFQKIPVTSLLNLMRYADMNCGKSCAR